jgi:H+/Cl- antiporter ClcA
MIRRALDWFEQRNWHDGATLMVFGAVIGVVSGLAVVAFYRLIDLAHFPLVQWPERRIAGYGPWLYWPILTAIGLWAARLSFAAREIRTGRTF